MISSESPSAREVPVGGVLFGGTINGVWRNGIENVEIEAEILWEYSAG